MKIESGRGVSSSTGARKAGHPAAPGFAPATDAPQRASVTTGVNAIPTLDAILALQGDEPSSQRRARLARRGRDALDALEQLEHGLVLGRAPGALRAQLESLRCTGERTGDSGLDEVLEEIDIRVAVELAKLEKAVERA